ncbi:MAG: hypothetical protein ACRDTE_17135 [Pseudonocardiaceae bacterium]
MSQPDQEPMIDLAGGDPALSRHLRNCLKVLRDRTGNSEVLDFADDVLGGRRSLREAVTSLAFAQALDPQVAQFAQRYERLNDDDRERLAAEGDRQFAEQRTQAAHERRGMQGQPRRRDDPEDFSQWSWLE